MYREIRETGDNRGQRDLRAVHVKKQLRGSLLD